MSEKLSDQRHELFARAVAAGVPVKYAYIMAGLAPRRISDAYRLADRPDVMLRIAELKRTSAGFGQIAAELRQLASSIEHFGHVARLYDAKTQ